MKQLLKKITPIQAIVYFYFFSILLLSVLFYLPFSLQKGVSLSFIDALFTATSTISVTGLSSISLVDTFSLTGIIILILGLQLGGIGIMALGTFIWTIARKKIGLKERQLIMVDQNQSKLAGLANLMKQIFVLFISIEIIGSIILGTYFLFFYYDDPKTAFLHGVFASVSATTNAGFDITGYSLIPFKHDYFVQIIVMILVVLGSIGFPVLVETKNYLLSKNKRNYRFSLFTKLTSVTYLWLVAIGMISIFLFEFFRTFQGEYWLDTFFYTLFHSITTRSAGLTTMDITQYSTPTLLIMSVLMFIGASPSSVGGGIRTTTFAVNLLFLYHFAKGNREVKIFKRELEMEDILKSFVVTILSVILCFVGVIVLTSVETFSLTEIIFEVTSAFGTTGLSLGITASLTPVSKIVLMILMFAGRVGFLSFLFFLGNKQNNKRTANYHYPKEKITIG